MRIAEHMRRASTAFKKQSKKSEHLALFPKSTWALFSPQKTPEKLKKCPTQGPDSLRRAWGQARQRHFSENSANFKHTRIQQRSAS
jgi:hypothetical protein